MTEKINYQGRAKIKYVALNKVIVASTDEQENFFLWWDNLVYLYGHLQNNIAEYYLNKISGGQPIIDAGYYTVSGKKR